MELYMAAAHNNLGLVLRSQDKPDEAIGHYREALRLKPDLAEAHNNLGKVLAVTGRHAEANGHFREAVRLKPDWPAPLNDLAWILATCADAGVRDASEAVELAERACELTGHEDAAILDTLAAAYAEAGRFGQAVTTAQTAMALATHAPAKELADTIGKRLELYRQAKPYRENVQVPEALRGHS
jgi:spermidine synthase